MTVVVQRLTDENEFEEIGRVEDGEITSGEDTLTAIDSESVWTGMTPDELTARFDGPRVMAAIRPTDGEREQTSQEAIGTKQTPEGVPDGYVYVSPDEEVGDEYDVVESDAGGTYRSPEPVDDADGAGKGDSTNTGPQSIFPEPTDQVFQELIKDEEMGEMVTNQASAWSAWPTDSNTASMWHAAEAITGNDNDPEDITGTPMLFNDPDPESVAAYEEYQSRLTEKLREEHGEEVTAHRFIHGEAAQELQQGGSLDARTLGSWTADADNIDELVSEIAPDPDAAREDGVVVTMDVPVENVMDHHDANPVLDDAGQDEIVAALDFNTDLASGDVQTLDEL